MFLKSILIFLSLFVSLLDAKSILYKVDSKSNTVYILGSIHLAKPELYPLDNAIIEAYKKSDILVVEIDAETPEAQTNMQTAMLQLGLYSDNKNLKTELNPKTYKQLEDYTSKAGVSLEVLHKMRPWMVMLQLSIVEMLRLGYSPELGIDKHFIDMARVDNKSIKALESIDEQMALLSKDDRVYQDKLLRYTIESMNEIEPMLENLFLSWEQGDAEAIEKMLLLSMKNEARNDNYLDEIYDALITKRNKKMSTKILSYLNDKKNYFVVVGAGHVIGKDGIIDLLEKRGYKAIQK